MFLREDVVFGPIQSRRLGKSLGVNLLPAKGKLCNFDCIYCECGWNADGRNDKRLPTAAEVRSALEDKLTALMLEGTSIDSITFSGDGEPTLNPEFPRIIDDTLHLRDCFCPDTKVTVLSNATRAGVPEIFEALRKVDNPVLKLDAPTDELAVIINRPAPGYSIQKTVEALKRFEGEFILQTMFLKAPGFDSSVPEVVDAWIKIARELNPREIMVYTIARQTPMQELVKFSPAEMAALVKPLTDEGFRIQIKG